MANDKVFVIQKKKKPDQDLKEKQEYYNRWKSDKI